MPKIQSCGILIRPVQCPNTQTPHHIYVHLCLAQCPRCVAQGPRCVAQCQRCVNVLGGLPDVLGVLHNFQSVLHNVSHIALLYELHIHGCTGHRQHLLANVTYIVCFKATS